MQAHIDVVFDWVVISINDTSFHGSEGLRSRYHAEGNAQRCPGPPVLLYRGYPLYPGQVLDSRNAFPHKIVEKVRVYATFPANEIKPGLVAALLHGVIDPSGLSLLLRFTEFRERNDISRRHEVREIGGWNISDINHTFHHCAGLVSTAHHLWS